MAEPRPRGRRGAAGADDDEEAVAAAQAAAAAAAAQGANQAAMIAAAIGAAIQAMRAAVAQPPLAAAAPPAPGRFAMAPGLCPMPAINMSTLTGIKVYNHSIEALEPRFDGASGKIFGFLEQFQSAIVERGWTEINTVPKLDGTTELWIPNYASHSMDSLRAHVLTYVNGQTRQAQDSFAMYTMLQKSLEPSYFATVATAANKEMYMVNGMGAGVLFLKAIIMDVHHDLKGKASTIQQRLMDLPSYMTETKFDIKAFNEHVTSRMAELDAHGEQSTDLIEYLWHAYMVVPDSNFTKYISNKKDDHDEESHVFTPKELMKAALDKATLMKDQGVWLKAVPEGEQYLALMAKIENLEKSKLQLENRLKQGSAPVNRAKAKGAATAKPRGKPKGKPTEQGDRKLPEWKTKKTKDTITQKDEKSGKTTTYYWCPHHAYYTVHKPADCSKADTKPAAQANAAVVMDTVHNALVALQADE
jgi:hypothetical protein